MPCSCAVSCISLSSGGIHALRLCSVPLDVDYNLKRLREVAKIVPYFSRMLRHSRQLLMLYLAGQTNSKFTLNSSTFNEDQLETRENFGHLQQALKSERKVTYACNRKH